MIEEIDKQIYALWQKEQEFLKHEQENHPELFVKSPRVDDASILSRIGIILPNQNLPKGFIKYQPTDFIVEELLLDGGLVDVDYKPINKLSGEPKPFLSAELVKAGISTIEAVKELALNLKLGETQIGTAGIKDAEAITAQKITLSGFKLESLENYPSTNHFLKNLEYANGHIKPGNLIGNRFTIFIRTEHAIEENLFETKIKEMTTNGFWNFYWFQRFGNRVLTHLWGLYMYQGRYEKALRSYLCDPGPFELPYYANIRAQANLHFENWEEMEKVFRPMPYTFRYELMMLDVLKEYRRDYISAFRQMPEQIKLWVYAYSSFLTNKILSQAVLGQIEIGQNLPLLLNKSPETKKLYEQFLIQDKVPMDFEKYFKRLDFIRFGDPFIPVKVLPKVIDYKIVDKGVVISFDLSKGSYATTFLAHLFTLSEYTPLPDWLDTKEIDVKGMLGTGSLKETKEIFSKYLETKNSKIW